MEQPHTSNYAKSFVDLEKTAYLFRAKTDDFVEPSTCVDVDTNKAVPGWFPELSVLAYLFWKAEQAEDVKDWLSCS